MKFDRDLALRAVFVLALLAALAWVWNNTEWVEERVPLPPRGEAAHDGAFIAKQLVQRLGGRVVSPEGTATLPPPNVTLLLASGQWDLFAGRSERLHRWVESGGHLVIDSRSLRESMQSWLPVQVEKARPLKPSPPQSNDDDEQEDDDDADLARAYGQQGPCHLLRESDEFPAVFPERRGFVRCGSAWRRLVSKQAPSWVLDNPALGAEVLRVAVGRGRVTVLSGDFSFGAHPRVLGFSNFGLARGDNAALLVALLDLHAGDEVWFATNEDRAPFLAWLWQRAAPAVVLALASLTLALWRGFSRFGPLMAEPVAVRRSMGEQIRGTAEFLWHRQPQALHAAQVRALHEAARWRLGGYDQLDATQRMLALARATGVDARMLARALDGRLTRTRAAWADTLAQLEAARRALLPPPTSTTTPTTRTR